MQVQKKEKEKIPLMQGCSSLEGDGVLKKTHDVLFCHGAGGELTVDLDGRNRLGGFHQQPLHDQEDLLADADGATTTAHLAATFHILFGSETQFEAVQEDRNSAKRCPRGAAAGVQTAPNQLLSVLFHPDTVAAKYDPIFPSLLCSCLAQQESHPFKST